MRLQNSLGVTLTDDLRHRIQLSMYHSYKEQRRPLRGIKIWEMLRRRLQGSLGECLSNHIMNTYNRER